MFTSHFACALPGPSTEDSGARVSTNNSIWMRHVRFEYLGILLRHDCAFDWGFLRRPCQFHVCWSIHDSPLQVDKRYNWWTVLNFNEHFGAKMCPQILCQRTLVQNKKETITSYRWGIENQKRRSVTFTFIRAIYMRWRHQWRHYFIMSRIV